MVKTMLKLILIMVMDILITIVITHDITTIILNITKDMIMLITITTNQVLTDLATVICTTS